jgi:peptide/nickel transport system substrate-binding protein
LRKIRWQIVVVLLALAAIGVLLFSQQQTTLPGQSAEDQPVKGGVYSEALIGAPGRFNPLLDFYNPVDYDVDRLLYSSLVRFDHRGLPHGDLAETWGISRDGKVYNFSIRPQAVWQDGTPVTSEDVLFTLDLLRSDELPAPPDLKEFWKQIEVLPLDEKTIQFRLPEPFAPFLDYLTFGVLPRHLLEGNTPAQLVDSPFNFSPVGSGAYRFNSLIVEDGVVTGVVLDAFADYYGERPYIDKIIFRYYPDEAAALAAFDRGDVQGVSQVSESSLPSALRNEKMQVFTGRLPRLNLVYLNLDDPQLPFFQDPKVRRALLMSINRRWIVDRLLKGQGILANGPIFPESWASYDGVEQVPYDPEQAVALLKEAGYSIPAEGGNVREKDGDRLSFELVYPEGEISQAIAERLRQDWAKVGVEANLVAAPYEKLVDEYLEPRTYQAALAELNFTRSPDPDPYPFWHQAQITGGQNYSQWDDRQVSEYLEQARVQDEINERARRYRNFQVRFAAQMPALPLFYPVYSYAVSKDVRGASMGPLYDPSDRFNTLAAWFLRTGEVAQAPSK